MVHGWPIVAFLLGGFVGESHSRFLAIFFAEYGKTAVVSCLLLLLMQQQLLLPLLLVPPKMLVRILKEREGTTLSGLTTVTSGPVTGKINVYNPEEKVFGWTSFRPPPTFSSSCTRPVPLVDGE